MRTPGSLCTLLEPQNGPSIPFTPYRFPSGLSGALETDLA